MEKNILTTEKKYSGICLLAEQWWNWGPQRLRNLDLALDLDG